MRTFSLAGIRTRVIFLVCLVAVPIALLIVFNAREQRRAAVEHATAQAANVMNFAVISEEEILRDTEWLLSSVADAPAVAAGRGSCETHLAHLLRHNPRYLNFGVARGDGWITCSALPLKTPVNIADRSYFREALKNRALSIGHYQVGRITGKASINFGYPVVDGKGKVTGVVFGALDLSLVTKFEYEVGVQTPANSTFVKLDRAGAVLASFPASHLFGEGNPLEKFLFEKIAREKKGTFRATGNDGVERMYLFSPLRGPLYREGAYVLLGIPVEALFAESDRALARNLAVLAAVLLLALAIAWVGGNALIVRPVGVLVDASNRLAAGELSARSGLPAGSDELGQLGRAFDEMAGKLEREIAERSEAERQTAEGLKRLLALHEIDRNIVEGAKVEEALERVCEAVLEMGYPVCWVGLAQPDRTVLAVAGRGVPMEVLTGLEIRWDDSPRGHGPSGIVIRTGKSLVCRDIQQDARFAPWRDWVVGNGYRTMASLPLSSGEGETIGVLHACSARQDVFGEQEVSDLAIFAQQCTVALMSARRLEELRDANQRLTFHVNRMPLGYIVWDREFRVSQWNPAAERIFGWTEGEAMGRHSCELIIPPEAQPHVDRVWSRLLEKDPSSYSLNANVRKDGKPITCEWFNAPLLDASGNVSGVLSMVHDVTEKTTLERQLQVAQRMEAIGTLAGGIAHDFNNALTGIFGFGELLMMQLAGNERALASLAEIRRCAERASTLTRQLLTYARRQIIEPVNLSLNAVVTELLKLVSKVVGEQIEIRTFLAEDLPTVRGDAGQVEQVLMNLVLNARDAMPGGGQLLIETGVADLDAEYVRYHPYMAVGRYVVLTVSDTGTGMDARIQERVFDPFFSTKGPDKGTGLGLSMVYGIVKQHGGFIHLYSEPGKGSTFKVYLPPVDAAPDEAVPRRPAAVRGGTETVLLAEDDESVRSFVERTLAEAGYTVLSARNGEEAIELFRTNADKIALALMDVVMPGKGGNEAYEAMSDTVPGLKVVFMSGYTANGVHDSFVLRSGVPFLPKPFGPDAVLRKVREVLDGEAG